MSGCTLCAVDPSCVIFKDDGKYYWLDRGAKITGGPAPTLADIVIQHRETVGAIRAVCHGDLPAIGWIGFFKKEADLPGKLPNQEDIEKLYRLCSEHFHDEPS